MLKLKHKSYYDDVYKCRYVFLLNVKDDKHVQKILKKYYKETYRWYQKENTDGSCTIENCGGKNIRSPHRQLIITKYSKTHTDASAISYLVHECLHAVTSVFSYRGVEYNPIVNATNEHFTYYLEMLIEKALSK